MFTDMMFGTDTELTLAAEAAYFGVATEKLNPKGAITAIGKRIVDGFASIGGFIKKLIDKLKKLITDFVFDKLDVEYIEVTRSEHAIIKQMNPLIGSYTAYISKEWKQLLGILTGITNITVNVANVITRDKADLSPYVYMFEKQLDTMGMLTDLAAELTGNVKTVSQLNAKFQEYFPNTKSEEMVKIPVKTLEFSKMAYKTVVTVLEPLRQTLDRLGNSYKDIIDPLNDYPIVGAPATKCISQVLNANINFVNQLSQFSKEIVAYNEALLSRVHKRRSSEVDDIG